MRMWMIDPVLMCDKHLLGEHVEIHMLVGTLKRGMSIDGYLSRGLLEPSKIYSRHDAIIAEMVKRGMKHKSQLEKIDVSMYGVKFVDLKKSIEDLIKRCKRCSKRIKTNGRK